ncbi:hypothetical protein MYX77_09225 [Acidobacteriia bacterium AH_259_A11_L15]|nr:hypothetical protein [Acidobacteriia bacterium AH_259_A11_L15]
MEPLLILWIVALILGGIFELIILVKAWQDSIFQFLLCLFFPLYIFYYAFARLASGRRGLIVGGYVVCVLLVLILWSSSESLSTPKVEVIDFECVQTGSDILMSGTVKNVSDKPLSLTATGALIFDPDHPAFKTAGLRSRRFEGTVTPKSLPPGSTGRFQIRGQVPRREVFVLRKLALPGGDCRLDPFTDDSTGDRVNYREP